MDFEELKSTMTDELKAFVENDLKPRLAVDFIVANAVYTE